MGGMMMFQHIHPRFAFRALAFVVAAALARTVVAAAPSPECKPAADALAKQIVTPTHVFTTHDRKGRSEESESIYAQGAIYVKLHGTWRRSPMTVDQMRQQHAENVRNAKAMSCRVLRVESVDGQPATVY